MPFPVLYNSLIENSSLPVVVLLQKFHISSVLESIQALA